MRKPAGDSGAGFTEYAGLVVLAALILGSLTVLGLQTRLGEGVRTTICEIFQGTDCGRQGQDGTAGKNASNGDKNGPGNATGAKKGDAAGNKKDDGCHGFWGCAWSGVKQVGSGLYNVGKAVVDDFVGVYNLITDPSSIGDAISYIWHHPLDAVRQLFVDDETVAMWKRGDYGGAIGRTIWNVGSWFIPYYDIGKAFSKVGKLGKLGKLAEEAGKLGKVGKLAEDSGKAARRAEQLADKGDVAGANKAAQEAERKADDAAKEARKNGCKVVGLGGPGLRPLIPASHVGRYAAALPMALPAAPPCKVAQAARDTANSAKESVARAVRDKKIDKALKNGRYEDADNLIDQARNAAKTAEQRAKDRPTPANKEAARKARTAAETANKRAINQKIGDARKSTDPDRNAEADAGEALRNNLVNFQKKYGPNARDGEVDVETNKAIVEVKNGSPGKTGFKNLRRDLRAKMARQNLNPSGKPWIVYAPGLSAYQARRLEQLNGVKVVQTTEDLKNAVRALGEPVN